MSDEKTEPDILEGEFVERRAEAPEAKRVNSKGVSRLPWILAGILLVFIAGIFSAPWAETGLYRIAPGLFPKQEKTPVAPAVDLGRIDRLEQKLAQIEQRLDDTGQEPPLRGPTADFTDLSARLAALEAATAPKEFQDMSPIEDKLTELEQQIAGLNSMDPATTVVELDPEIIGGIEARLALIEAAQKNGLQQGQFAMALSAFERQMKSGKSYLTELNAVRSFNKNENTDFSVLEAHAMSGIPAMDALLKDYPAAARSALIAGSDTDDGWLSRTFSKLKGVVTVRRVGDIEGSDPEAILSRAEIHLQNKDLASAVTELVDLPEQNKSAMRQWLADAALRLQAEQVLAGLWRQAEEGSARQ